MHAQQVITHKSFYRAPTNYRTSALNRIETGRIMFDTVCFRPGRSLEPRIVIDRRVYYTVSAYFGKLPSKQTSA